MSTAERPPHQDDHRYRRAVVYFLWGRKFLSEGIRSARSVKPTTLPRVLLTDAATASALPSDHPFTDVRTTEIPDDGMLTKLALYDRLPDEYDSFLYLDSDTFVLGDVSFGFEKAERFGIAMAAAANYALDNHWGFGDTVLANIGVPCAGQLQYNAGVIFFVRRPDVDEVFRRATEMAYELTDRFGYKRTDQPFVTLAMETLGFNPYTLSSNYNYRPLAGPPISGDVRIWHSHQPVPPDLNEYQVSWPPRRYVGTDRVEQTPLRLFALALRPVALLARRFRRRQDR